MSNSSSAFRTNFLFKVYLLLICQTFFLISASVTEKREVLYLSGKGSDDTVLWDFLCSEGRNSGQWSKIAVPSCWELQGFGRYNYGHGADKSGKNRFLISPDSPTEEGHYKRTFNVPVEWRQRVNRIVFEGVLTDAQVKINGQPAGEIHQGGYYVFRYDISKLLKYEEENLIEVSVRKSSSNSSVNDAERKGDYWAFGGIFRPVSIESLPSSYIDRTAIDAKADGSFSADVFVAGDKAKIDKITAEIEGIGEKFTGNATESGSRFVFKTKVEGQKNWTAETPQLYWVNFKVLSEGKVLHEHRQRFGFRTIEVRTGEGFYVNGRRVQLRGACRHCFWPETGRTLSEKISRDDIALMQKMNMNAVRCVHYPPDKHFLEACDELGMYVLNELAGWHGHYDTVVGKKLVESMVTDSLNHPCIIAWDNGNEGGWNKELDNEYSKWDPQNRTVLHPFEYHGGIQTKHYPKYDVALNLASGSNNMTLKLAGDSNIERIPYLPTEFSHGLHDGGAGASLEDFWEGMRREKSFAGGFIWALIDEAVVRRDFNNELDSNGIKAPDGILGPYREKEGSFYTIQQLWSPIQIINISVPTIEIENRYDHLNLKGCIIEWQLLQNIPPSSKEKDLPVIDSGKYLLPSIEPWAKGKITLETGPKIESADYLKATAIDHSGRAICSWTFPVRKKTSIENFPKEKGQLPVLSENSSSFNVSLGTQDYQFDKTSGKLKQITKGKEIIPFAGPRFVGSTLEVVKKIKDGKEKEFYNLLDLSKGENLVNMTAASVEFGVSVTSTFSGVLRSTQWDFTSDSKVRLKYKYQLDTESYLAGIDFTYPLERLHSMRWLGEGPDRVYQNRLKGTQWGIWDSIYKEHKPLFDWSYLLFRGFRGKSAWVEYKTAKEKITIYNPSVDKYFGTYATDTDGIVNMDFSETQMAILDVIPPSGDKFKKPKDLGPQSKINPPLGVVEGEIWIQVD